MAYKSIKDIVSVGSFTVESKDDNLLDYGERLMVLNSLLDVVGCVLDVVRHNDAISQIDYACIHPMSQICGGKPDKLLESTTQVISWVQEVMFADRRDYDVSTNGQRDGEHRMTESEIIAAEEIEAKKGGNGHEGKDGE